MLDMDFKSHNARSREVWDAWHAGDPIRVPVTIYADSRNWMAEPHLNTNRIALPDYLRDPELMLQVQVRAREWIRCNILSDDGMGLPEEGWPLIVDFQNYLEMAWFGAEVHYTSEPHCKSFLDDDRRDLLFTRGLPDPWQGIGADVRRYYEYFQERRQSFTWQGLPIGPISMPFNMTGTDGPFTLAAAMRGTETFVYDMIDHPDYARQLLDFITDAIINRIKAVRQYLGEPERGEGFGFADDAIVMLSTELYESFVLPCHRKIFSALTTGDNNRSFHLCGDAQRFFPILQKHLNVRSFDTGFPIRFEKLYDELDADTCIIGGPPVGLLLNGTPAQIDGKVREILQSGVMTKSRRFVLREANALAPGTPLDHVNQIYRTCIQAGWYKGGCT